MMKWFEDISRNHPLEGLIVALIIALICFACRVFLLNRREWMIAQRISEFGIFEVYSEWDNFSIKVKLASLYLLSFLLFFPMLIAFLLSALWAICYYAFFVVN